MTSISALFSRAEVLAWLELSATLALAILAGRAYGRIWRTARKDVWKHPPAPFNFADVLVCVVLLTWLGGNVYQGFSAPPRELTDANVLESGMLLLVILSGIALLLHMRGLSLVKLFGLRPPEWGPLLKRSVWLLLAALPLVYAAFLVVTAAGVNQSDAQEITLYFQRAAVAGDFRRMGLVVLLAAVMAPVAEEFLFRGYFYGVLRRYLGVTPSLIFVSALFAAIHLNGPVFLPLFVLAACLTLAYEATGSLVTCVVMHSLFNTTMLALMYYTARHP